MRGTMYLIFTPELINHIKLRQKEAKHLYDAVTP